MTSHSCVERNAASKTSVEEDPVTSDSCAVTNAVPNTCVREDPATSDNCVVKNAVPSTCVQEDPVTSDNCVVRNAASGTSVQDEPVTSDSCVVRNAASNTCVVLGLLIGWLEGAILEVENEVRENLPNVLTKGDPGSGKWSARKSSEYMEKWLVRTSPCPARTSPYPARTSPCPARKSPLRKNHIGDFRALKIEIGRFSCAEIGRFSCNARVFSFTLFVSFFGGFDCASFGAGYFGALPRFF